MKPTDPIFRRSIRLSYGLRLNFYTAVERHPRLDKLRKITIAEVVDSLGRLLYQAKAYCNPSDKFDAHVGELTALDKIIEHFEKVLQVIRLTQLLVSLDYDGGFITEILELTENA